MKKVGFSVVGLGMGYGRSMLINDLEGANLASVVDLQEDLAKKVADELGCKWTTKIDDALGDDEVDVMVIITPSGTHGPLVIRCLEAGKHVMVTKPMEVTVEKCEAMLEAQRKSGKLLGTDFQRRYEEPYARAKYALENGLLGKPVLGEARLKWYRGQDYYDRGTGWRGTWKMDGGGALANQSIHEIDVLTWLMGMPKKVIGQISTLTHDIETEDLGMAMLEFESGAVGTVLGTTTGPVRQYEGLEIHGTEGAFRTTSGEEVWQFTEGNEDRLEKIQRFTPFMNAYENFVATLRDGAEMICSAEAGRDTTKVLCAIYESGHNGHKPVYL